MSEKARERNVVVMVEELKGVAGSGLRGGAGDGGIRRNWSDGGYESTGQTKKNGCVEVQYSAVGVRVGKRASG